MADKTKLTDANVSAIDRAIAAANARKATKASATGATPKAPKAPKAPAAPKEPKKPLVTDEEKAARLAARDEIRATNKANRAADRAVKLAERTANRKPAHMRKVEKAAEKLGSLGQASLLLFNEATANLTAAELATLALHIQHFNRAKATERAIGQKIEAGMNVEIVGGDPRFIGRVGTVAKAQRIRCYVTLEGMIKPVYLFTSDVAQLAAMAAVATG